MPATWPDGVKISGSELWCEAFRSCYGIGMKPPKLVQSGANRKVVVDVDPEPHHRSLK